MLFLTFIGMAAALHNLSKFLEELSTIVEKNGIEVYALLMLLSGLLALAGLWLMNLKKKSATLFLTSAALICLCENLLGADAFSAFLWTLAYGMAGAGSFYQINIGMKLPGFEFITKRQLIEKTIGQLADTEKIMNEQKTWIKNVNTFMKTYGVLTYYIYVTIESFCIITPLIYFYRYIEKLPTENVFYDSAKWTLIIFAAVVALGEIQRKYLINNEE